MTFYSYFDKFPAFFLGGAAGFILVHIIPRGRSEHTDDLEIMRWFNGGLMVILWWFYGILWLFYWILWWFNGI